MFWKTTGSRVEHRESLQSLKLARPPFVILGMILHWRIGFLLTGPSEPSDKLCPLYYYLVNQYKFAARTCVIASP